MPETFSRAPTSSSRTESSNGDVSHGDFFLEDFGISARNQVMFFTERLEAPDGISGRIPGTSRVSTTSSILWDGGGGYTLVPDRISWVLPTKLVAPAFSLLTLSRNGQTEPRLPAAIRTGVGTLEALQKLTGASRVKSVGTT